jgi:hypothetical protein
MCGVSVLIDPMHFTMKSARCSQMTAANKYSNSCASHRRTMLRSKAAVRSLRRKRANCTSIWCIHDILVSTGFSCIATQFFLAGQAVIPGCTHSEERGCTFAWEYEIKIFLRKALCKLGCSTRTALPARTTHGTAVEETGQERRDAPGKGAPGGWDKWQTT